MKKMGEYIINNRYKRKTKIVEEKTNQDNKIHNVTCPVCKSKNNEHIIKRNNNGVFGRGFRSWIIDDYFVCENCGVIFKKIEK
jgi:C4-type Zn-finger protein